MSNFQFPMSNQCQSSNCHSECNEESLKFNYNCVVGVKGSFATAQDDNKNLTLFWKLEIRILKLI